MKLHILGCYSPYPPVNGAGPGYLLEHKGTKVLLDCGSGVVSRLGRVCDFCHDDLNAVILSHLHADHFCDLLVLRYGRFIAMRAGKARPLAVYAPEKPELERSMLPFLDALDIGHITSGTLLKIGEMQFEFVQTLHPYPNLAIKASANGRTIIYTGDTAWHEPLVEFCHGADLLLAEASFLEKNKGANAAQHLSAGDAGQLAEKARVNRLVLTHFWPMGDQNALREEARAHFGGEIILASSGLALEI